ncbi:hypothetical protein C6Y39_04475 [Alteromonas gracilis]|uniref:Uncharacterized protein n=1 Tax=Alteromonas gracilis TaxID=1479524 RepID=A0ABX5CTA6_9ALTE|nr:hypothetical protein C6Y39_04475 [Alteromonas gracilis]
MESEHFIIMVDQPFWVSWLLIYGTTLLGSLVMYLFSFSKGFDGAIEVLKRLFPEREKAFYHRLDCVLTVCLGAAVGALLFSPTNPVQAVTAGLGWVSAVNILMSNKESS